MSGQQAKYVVAPAIELLILLEIIEAVSSDECGGSVPFRAAAVNYLAGRARAIAVELMEEGVGTLHPPPSSGGVGNADPI